MNLRRATGALWKLSFRIARAAACIVPGGRIAAFGSGLGTIGKILVINLDRQPSRWRRVTRELRRFKTADGVQLNSIAQRFPAVDARDGRAVAATADVDPNYCLANQLYVQPDPRLEKCFSGNEPIRMTRQEVAVARSHVEVWKTVATGADDFVLILEDDVWFRPGAATAIDCGWRAALRRRCDDGEPQLLYFSYEDAGGTAERADACEALFRPKRGLWFLSGYVLSRRGAATLLRAMPIVGPVDTWMNYRFDELGALALSSPAILQRQDNTSDNSYSVLPYLARAGIVDAGLSAKPPHHTLMGRVIAWTARGDREGVAMALSMLGLRVRVFDGDETPIRAQDLLNHFEVFDALVDPPLAPNATSTLLARKDCKFIWEAGASLPPEIDLGRLPSFRTAVLWQCGSDTQWKLVCTLLGLAEPAQSFPLGARRALRVFRDDRSDEAIRLATTGRRNNWPLDDSPWVLPLRSNWQPCPPRTRQAPVGGERLVHAPMTMATPAFLGLTETFPGSLATFSREGLVYTEKGTHLTISEAVGDVRPYRSGAFVSKSFFEYGRFEADIKAASGSGLITGFFLYRDSPRQEIDIEFAGHDPRRMIANVYFNPGDEGATVGFGYRGSPWRIDLGFDATLDFHRYTIEWRPGRISWSVDGKIVHERAGWDPTPVPHHPLRVYANLWAPSSEELAGRLDGATVPSTAMFRNIEVWA